MPHQDPRLPLRFGPAATRRPNEALLTEGWGVGPTPSFTVAPVRPAHLPGCACCAPRSAAAVVLAEIHRARAVGSPFEAVLADVTPATAATIRLALDTDVLASARFRLA